ncbi:excinuclease ABC subunit UvrA [Synergistes jonesii]|uniref:UvrABC system protein A n=1 Tax=Synergistes jonesii TaxID=2754 RepID=A0A073IPH0_9BACT|nr:excinuclease ABC subunit UvrA [Synergistes jonesii]KEJ91455.1 excinuclease ABC subunit A [Synergistes jonesii]OFB60512.1 excinuclease ABC subunit A [Synergistes jonesii]OFB61522.1 excinuclease ABC subunit A [Synergistes jonesii]OFB64492.1 excinuclease ABC subunit A [Synergistes jonesii]OFB66690.1 excinuclease ABC subunit A [Synergistes jonesii]
MDQEIRITGARQHNLRNIDAVIPKNKLVVVTGPSGSGKSSLAFDTIYAEGQRRYVESLSSYARQFLGMSDKPDVDDIAGLSPAISIEQKGTNRNPRSTVGTVTEIYDYLRLLFGRAGTPHCPKCGKEVHRYSVDEIIDLIYSDYAGKPLEIYAPIVRGKKGEYKNLLLKLHRQGYMRARVDGTLYWLEEEVELDKNRRHTIECLIDRMRVREENRSRMSEAVEMALKLSEGFIQLASAGMRERELTEKYVCPDCQISLPEIEPRLFSFNAPFGACPDCAGLGFHSHFSAELAVNPALPLGEGGFIPWKSMKYMVRKAEKLAEKKGWDISKPFGELPESVKQELLYGSDEVLELVFVDKKNGDWEYNGKYCGLIPWLEKRYNETESENYKEELSRYLVEDLCATCKGRRLKPEVLAVTLGGRNIGELTEMPIDELIKVLDGLKLGEREQKIVGIALTEVKKRLSFLNNVGAGYLSLSRRAETLSGGESQRIRLASQIGSQLTGVLYVLDEPTIGLHPRDTGRLLETLKTIRDLGNSVLVVEHDRDTMVAADHILELGPGAGEKGGELIANGSAEEIMKGGSSTALYLRGEADGTWLPAGGRRTPRGAIKVRGAAENNLKKLDIDVPLGVFAALSGVSGSGKSTFLYEILYKGLRRKFDGDYRERPGKFDSISGYESLRNIVLIDQSPIGRTPRSNPATYTGAFTPIREFYAQLQESKLRGYDQSRFSFNLKGGRCEACNGDGVIKVSMLFLPDVFVKCDVCRGQRYNRETLEVKYKELSIADVLELTVDEAVETFGGIPRIANKLKVMQEAGLGYIKLGQPAPTLSGGEAQRVKLATELGKKFRGSTLYLLDEPTTGLHYTDVKKLLKLLHKLVDQGGSVLVIEHNLDVLASSDYIMDLGPEGGRGGGKLVAKGTPEEVARGKGPTSKYLAQFLKEIKSKHEGK